MDVRELKILIEKSWQKQLSASPLWAALEAGTYKRADYAAYLIQTFHYTRRSPLIQAAAIPHFQLRHRHLAGPFLKHAAEEESHYRLALLDCKRLGYATDLIENSQPAPLTEGYLGFIFNRITYVNPLAYLGYLFQLEYLAITLGPRFAERVLSCVPEASAAMSFLKTHAHEDQDHVRELEEILDGIDSTADAEEINYVAVTASALYFKMMDDAFLWAQKDQT